jgi:thiamine biosynthesis lipoprotein ApbE
MNRRLALVTALAGSLAAGAAGYVALGQSGPQTHEAHFDGVMGTSLDIRIRAASDRAGATAEEALLGEIARLSKILSSYDGESEFSQWMRSSAVPARVSPELVEVLTAFDEWRTRTGGALDPSAEAIATVWRAAARENRLPSAADLERAVARIRQRHWIVDVRSGTVAHTSDVPLVLNSFTKSYIVDRAAARALAVQGVSGVLINAGGDVVVRGNWTQTVGVADPMANADNAAPLATIAVRDRVVATSGSYKRGFDIQGQHYSHVVDPRTGVPQGHVASATVVAADAVEAGALATAFCVLSPAESLALARSRSGVEFALVLADSRRIESAGWPALTTNRPAQPVVASPVATLYAAEQGSWDAGWRLNISLELARMSGMTRRPYLAVWIEDKDKFPVRTVALWYDGKSRYLPELRAWYRADRLRAMAEGSQIVDAVTSATRPAGTYTLQWDGKDNVGKPVARGSYTVCIEASREHGTYQIIRQEMDFNGMAKHAALPGGTEINAASLDYQQVGR